jgi:hypothetical protein
VRKGPNRTKPKAVEGATLIAHYQPMEVSQAKQRGARTYSDASRRALYDSIT